MGRPQGHLDRNGHHPTVISTGVAQPRSGEISHHNQRFTKESQPTPLINSLNVLGLHPHQQNAFNSLCRGDSRYSNPITSASAFGPRHFHWKIQNHETGIRRICRNSNRRHCARETDKEVAKGKENCAYRVNQSRLGINRT